MDAARPALSLVVPSNEQQSWRRKSSDRHETTAKQKRLFPVACRVVPTDQWFISRVDRTWNVIDLKLWLLSKALPTRTLPLPASFRPSSPVTFAPAPTPPPRPSTATSYHPPLPLTPPAASSPPTSPPTSPPASPPAPDPALAPVGSPTPSFGSEDDDDDYDRLDTDFDDDDDSRPTPRSIPYSFSTGAPAISGLDALRAKASTRTYGATAPAVDPELVTKAEAIARRWRLYSFSTGMLLSDDLPLAEYNLFPYELLELHRTAAYVRLPRPMPPPPHPADDAAAPTLHASHSTARAYHSTTNRRPSPSPARASASDSDSDSGGDAASSNPYAQPYFDAWVLVLGAGDAIEDVGADDGRKTRRRARAKSEAARALKGRDRDRDRDREWSELQKLIGNPPVADVDAVTAPAPQGELWRRRWVVLREGMLSVWRERRDATPEARFDVRACVGLHDAEKLPSILGAAAPTSPPPTAPVICMRFRTAPDDRTAAIASHKQPPRARAPWLVLQLPDTHTHDHILRTLHRLTYPTSQHPHPLPHPRARTLRTDFLPTPIPHPLALRFGAPSPASTTSSTTAASLPSPTAASTSTASTQKERDRPRTALGPGVGVRFPEWREFVLARAVRAGQGFPVDPGAAPYPPEDDPLAHASSDEDDDDSGGSEAEWAAWAYDLDRPRAAGRRGNRTPKTPHGSLVSLREALGTAPPPTMRERRRTRSAGEGAGADAEEGVGVVVHPGLTITTVTTTTVSHAPAGTLSVASGSGAVAGPSSSAAAAFPVLPSPRLRASTVSSLPSEELTTTSSVRTFEAGRVRGLMRGLSIRAGRDSFMRSLENALDFVDGK